MQSKRLFIVRDGFVEVSRSGTRGGTKIESIEVGRTLAQHIIQYVDRFVRPVPTVQFSGEVEFRFRRTRVELEGKPKKCFSLVEVG